MALVAVLRLVRNMHLKLGSSGVNMSQNSILPLLNISPIKAFQRAEQGMRPLPRSIVQTDRPSIFRKDVPLAPLEAPMNRFDMPLYQAAMRPQVGAPSLPPQPSMMQRLQADKPFASGLTAAGQALTEASGYTAQPKDTLGMIGDAMAAFNKAQHHPCLLYTSPSPRDGLLSRMPSSA